MNRLPPLKLTAMVSGEVASLPDEDTKADREGPVGEVKGEPASYLM